MGNNNIHIYLEVALDVAKRAGKLLLDNFCGKRKVNYKGRINLVTEMDILSEKLIVDSLKKEFPEHGILAEEGSRTDSDSGYLWIIDPLDGTTNYAHGFGFFAVSIALEEKDTGIIAGVVYAPYIDECYTASRGLGACLNGKPARVSSTGSLEGSMVATGFPYDVKESHDNMEYFNRFLTKTQAVRRPGSASIDLCSVAAGKFDGYWELKLYPWDTAAGSLIVEEAGGMVTGLNGAEFNPYKKGVLATNGLIHKEMLGVINEQ